MCGNLQLCAGLEAGIEGATHAVGQRRMERVRPRRFETEDEAATEDEEEEEERGDVLSGINNLRVETAVTAVEAAEGTAEALEMQVEEKEGSEGEYGGGGTQRAL